MDHAPKVRPEKHWLFYVPWSLSSLCSAILEANAEAAFEEQEVLMPAGKHQDVCSHSRGRQRQGEDQEGQAQVPGGSRNLVILPKRSGMWAVGSVGDVGDKGGEAVVFRNLLGKGPGFFSICPVLRTTSIHNKNLTVLIL